MLVPGPDGYKSEFYQKNWAVVGPDLVQAIQYFFSRGYMLKSWYTAAITLVPKVNRPATIKEYRPIACCNVPFTCISKILANRLQGVLLYLINKNQSAFSKGIVENVLLMQEVLRGYHKNSGSPRCAT